jgi:excinuclease ABC subunit A
VNKHTAVSHTAAALAPVLKAGPRVERPRYDPNILERPRADDVELEAVGKDAAMPWQTDGRRWHTVERVTNEGKPCRWEGHVLDWLDERIHEVGEFGDTVWNQRSIVEIAAPARTQGWFLHAMTGQEWLLRLVFRVAKNRFKDAELIPRLGIRPLNETPGLEVYSNAQRVWVTKHKGPWESVTVLVHRLSEIDTPAFREFLAEAATSFQHNLQRLRTKPEDLMPWKIHGERWHLSDKGFPPGKKVRWDRSLLTRLLQLVREVEPEVQVRWDGRDSITLRVADVNRAWAQWRTKKAIALECHFLGKKGQFNLSQIEDVGISPNIGSQRKDGDLLYLHFQKIDPTQAARLKELLADHLRGFREVFAKATTT